MSNLENMAVSVFVCLASLLVCFPVAGQTSPNVSLEFKSQPLLKILEDLGEQYNLNYVTSDEASRKAGKISCRLKNMPLARAIQMICASCHLEAQIQGNFVLIRLPRPGEAPKIALPPGPPVHAPQLGPRPNKSKDPSTEVSSTEVSSILKSAPKRAKPARQKRELEVESVQSRTAEQRAAFVGVIVSKTDNSMVAKSSEGEVMNFVLPSAGKSEKFRSSLFETLNKMKIGYRVLVLSKLKNGQREILGFLGGQDPRKKVKIELPEEN